MYRYIFDYLQFFKKLFVSLRLEFDKSETIRIFAIRI